MMRRGIILLWAAMASAMLMTPFAAKAQEICAWRELGSQAVLVEGRAMPLETYADDLASRVWRGEGCDRVSRVQQYCYLSFGKRVELQAKTGCVLQPRLEASSGRALTYEEAEGVLGLKLQALQVMERDPEMKGNTEAITKLRAFIGIVMKFRQIEKGQDWKFPLSDSSWSSLASVLSENGEMKAIELIKGSIRHLREKDRFRLDIETWLFRLNFPLWVLGFCLIGVVSGTVCREPVASGFMRAALVSSLLVLGVGLIARILVSGRAPVTNMFETVIWFGGVCLLGAFILRRQTREGLYLRLGFVGCSIAMLVALVDRRLLDASIKPLVPALRSDLWLSTHVLAVTGSYALFGISWLIANFALWTHVRDQGSEQKIVTLSEVNRRMIQWGALFLSLGIFLGALWADRSWGRFWGWDPKETWSLITLIVYMALLHGQYAGWFKPVFLHVLSVVSFLLVIMTWFGVNWIFAKGLHSYGFSSGGAAGVVVFCVVQLTLLLIFALKLESISEGNSAGRRGAAKSVAKVVGVGGAQGGAQA